MVTIHSTSFSGNAMVVPQRRQTPPDSPAAPKLLCIEPNQSESNKRKTVPVQNLYDNLASMMERARDIQANLPPEFPSFIKTMLQSHVGSGFSLGISRQFCNLHLPKHDATIVLEDEDGKVRETKYLVAKGALSAGWRGFSIDHKLIEGEILVFHLVSPLKFKIYIIRSNGSDEVDCALGPLKFKAHNAQEDTTVGDDAFRDFRDRAERFKPLLETGLDGDTYSQNNRYRITYQSDKHCGNIIPKRVVAHVEPKKFERKKTNVKGLCENWSPTMERAKAVQANIAPEFPSLVKTMVQSNVTGCFCLSLSRTFCSLYLPKHDAIIILEDENGNVFQTKYLVGKGGLSAGWRRFSIAHNLVERDVLVFHLVSPFQFKVYIIRSNDSDEVDCALGLLKLEACNGQVDNMDIVAFEGGTESLKPVLDKKPDDDDDNQKIYGSMDKDIDDIVTEVLDGIRLSDSVVAFEEVRSFEDFKILVNGLVINSELSKYLQGKYYELCCSQKAFLHENLLEGLNCKLVVGIISETINIADAIRASKITTSVNDFSIWSKTLIAFEGLGMNVRFLRARLDQLVHLATKSKRFEDVIPDQYKAHDKLRVSEAKILAVKKEVTRLDTEFETLGLNYHELELIFEKLASAPW